MSTAISETFARVRSQQRLAFMPFITAGDPDLEATCDLIRTLSAQGVDLIEIGFPYSDPIADGPVIQASYTRALAKHLHVADIFAALRSLTADVQLPPLVAMVSYAIIFRTGIERFVDQAQTAGLSGLIVPDLPGDEAGDVFQLVRDRGLDLVQLVAPTTPRARVRNILQCCSGFVYCIAVAGTTGVREQLAAELLDQLRWLRDETDLPLAVGFGISTPAHLAPLRGLAEGAIVGSAIVGNLQELADGKLTREEAIGAVARIAAGMVQGARSAGKSDC